MTKSAKRKKEKSSDFTKKKLKLGKGKQVPTNVLNTSFKARSIALPQQSIAVTNEATAPTTKRKLTLDALLAHLKHYGAGIRKDALHGLTELLGEYPELIERNLSKLVNGCVRLISDEDASVRKALQSFLSWLLRQIPREHLVPYAPTLLLFTASAQSHIFPEIRIDAIRVLDILLEHIPDQVVSGFWTFGTVGGQADHRRKLLDGYLGLLNVGTQFNEDGMKASGTGGQSITLVTLSATSKAAVLKSFSKFLHHATEQPSRPSVATQGHLHEGVMPLWFLSEAFSSHEAFASFASILSLQRSIVPMQQQVRLWHGDDNDGFSGQFPLSDLHKSDSGESILDFENIRASLGNDANSGNGLQSSAGRLLMSLCRTLHPVLISTFLDSAPSVFSPTQASSEPELYLIQSLMDIARYLYGRVLRDTSIVWNDKEAANEYLRILVGHISPYFPFGENRMLALDMKVDSAFQQMNLIYCELFSLQSLNYVPDPNAKGGIHGPAAKRRKLNHPQPNEGSPALRPGPVLGKQVERVREYVIRSLSGAPGSGVSAAMHPLGQSLTVHTYIALLPTLWWLLEGQSDEDYSAEIMNAVLQHAAKAGSLSGVKLAATEFVGRLVLLQSETSYRGSFKLRRFADADLQRTLRDWFCHLPRVLWELGDKNANGTELVLLLMLRVTQRRLWLNNIETATALCTRFAPFFTMQHATRGELRGPFARLDKTPVEAPTVSMVPSDPNYPQQQQRSGPAPIKRLALDVAGMLLSNVSSSIDQLQAHQSKSAPRKLPLESGRRTGNDGSSSKLGVDPVSVRPELSPSAADARDALRRAVDKAVSGTVEEAYWLSVSQI